MTRDEILLRIASALERQADQMDEQMNRSRKMREENVARHEQERDADLADVRATNEHLMAQMEAMLEKQARMVERYEQVTSERPRVGLNDVVSGDSRQNLASKTVAPLASPAPTPETREEEVKDCAERAQHPKPVAVRGRSPRY